MIRLLRALIVLLLVIYVLASPAGIQAQGSPKDLAILKKQLRDADVKVRLKALDSLLIVSPRPKEVIEIAEEIFALSKDADANVRQRAMLTLSWLVHEKTPAGNALDVLREHFKDADDLTRLNAVRSALFTEPKTAAEAVPVLIDFLRKQKTYRSDALSLLAQTGKPGQAALPELLDVLKSGSSFDLGLAINAIEKLEIDMKPALPILARRAQGKLAPDEAAVLAGVFAKHNMPELALAVRLLLLTPGHGARSELTLSAVMHSHPEPVLRALIPILKDPDPKTRALAAYVLANLERDRSSAIPNSLDQAIEKLASKSNELIENLRANLKDQDAEVRWTSAAALVRTKTAAAKEVVPYAVDWIKLEASQPLLAKFEQDVNLPGLLLSADPERAGTLVLAAVATADAEARQRFASAIRALPDAKLKPHLIAALKSSTSEQKQYALMVLRSTFYLQHQDMHNALAPHLIDALGDPQVMIRLDCVELLLASGKKTPERLLAVAVKALDEKEAPYRLRAIILLQRMGKIADTARPALLKTLDDPDSFVQVSAAQALLVIDPEKIAPIVPVLKRHLDMPNPQSLPLALQLAGRLGPAAAPLVPGLVAIIEDKQSPYRLSAAQELVRIDAKRTEPLVQTLLDAMSKPKWTRMEENRYVQILRQLGPAAKTALPAIHQSAQQGKPTRLIQWSATLAVIDPTDANPAMLVVRKYLSGKTEEGADDQLDMLLELERLGPKAQPFMPELIALLKTEKEVQVLSGTTYVLGAIGPAARDAVPYLEALAKTAKNNVLRNDAKSALAKIAGK